MASKTWLVKQEPSAYAWARFVEDGRTAWTGVRNYQARNNLRAMAVGDRVLYYHSNDDRAVIGIARVSRAAFPDPTADEPGWDCVELVPERALATPVTLARIKEDPALADIGLIRQSRLSVMPVPAAAFARIVKLGT